ncbi:MAG TPA: hypothetical protein VMZ28_00195 [Kofleriaceae bacterium]|nr:hypothetical protein [Kofleriaceae bacterium]
MLIRHLALALMVAGTGCVLVDGDDDDCDYGGVRADEAGAAVYDPGIRNPETGVCEFWGGGGGGGSCDACGNCPDVPTDEDRAPTPTWGSCESGCEGLDQATCEATPACRAIFVDGEPLTFAACWGTDTTGPIQGGGCEGLDAQTCSMHDDCSAVHGSTEVLPGDGDAITQAIGNFSYCTPEGGGGGGVGSCDGTATCERVEPACPEGTTPGISGDCYSGYCIPLEDCGDGAPDPGTCYGTVTDDQPPPACPDGTHAGVSNGLYTGYCIPDEACEEAPACAETIGEASCIARADCTPIYEGQDCTCDADVCDCAEWTFSHCE